VLDLVYVGVLIAFFAAATLLVRGCALILGPSTTSEERGDS
jgi:hypothetical protein